jgi:hypothetical protein
VTNKKIEEDSGENYDNDLFDRDSQKSQTDRDMEKINQEHA